MVRARASTMAVARVERRPNRMGQFFSVALMFMLLKSTQESFGRAYRGRRGSTGEESPRGAHGRGGVVLERRARPRGAPRGRARGAHRGHAVERDRPETAMPATPARTPRARTRPRPLARPPLQRHVRVPRRPRERRRHLRLPRGHIRHVQGPLVHGHRAGRRRHPQRHHHPTSPACAPSSAKAAPGVAVLQLRAGWDPRKRSHWTRRRDRAQRRLVHHRKRRPPPSGRACTSNPRAWSR